MAGINTLVGYDLVPEPKIIDAALRACRRLNDFASAVRILEVVKVSGAAAARGVTAQDDLLGFPFSFPAAGSGKVFQDFPSFLLGIRVRGNA